MVFCDPASPGSVSSRHWGYLRLLLRLLLRPLRLLLLPLLRLLLLLL